MYRIGIDIGGSYIKAGVVAEDYTIVAKAQRPTGIGRPLDLVIADIAQTAREAVQTAGLTPDDVAGVGAGCPGTCNPDTGEVEYANNLYFQHVPLVALLKEQLGKPVWIQNDANAAAWGEALAGAGRGTRSCVAITLGTGVGGGIVLDGKIFCGSNFAGAELGHMVIEMDGEECTCGRYGCWEAYASVTALIRQTKRAMAEHPETRMWELVSALDEVGGRTAFDAMRLGDTIATQVVQRYTRYIACGLVNIINIFQPEVLCIGGAISHEGETLLAPLRAHVTEKRYSKYSQQQTEICQAQLGNAAGIIGAAFLDRV